MDNVTHSLFALTLARTRLGRTRGATVALLLASNAPDIDVVSTAGGLASYLQWHRGPTHGPLGVLGLGLLTAALVRGGQRLFGRQDKPPGSFWTLAGVSAAGVCLHILMDLPTSYGTRMLSPFDWHWFAADWMPIVDIYLLVALLAGLYFGRGSDLARRRNVAIVLTLMAANYSVRGIAHERAIALAPRVLGPTMPAACEGTPGARFGPIDRWPQDTPPVLPGPGAGRCLIEVAAVPSFISPFEWRVIARMSNAYEAHDVDLLDTRFLRKPTEPEVLWRLGVKYPDQWSPDAIVAARAPTARLFLGFSRFPAARAFTDRQGTTTVQFRDMRFVTGAPSGRGRGGGVNPNSRSIFAATVRLDSAGAVVEDRLGQ